MSGEMFCWRFGPSQYNLDMAASRTETPATEHVYNSISDPTANLPLRWAILAVLVIAACGIAAYSNTFANPFILDDNRCIVRNESLRQLWPPWTPLMAPPLSRPVVNMSLAINYAIGGHSFFSYHVFNLTVHVLAAITLFGILWRTLTCKRISRHMRQAAAPLALAVAVIWFVHPLQTSAVTYIIQRAESLMGLFYLLTLYCAIRSFRSRSDHRRLWQIGAIVSCAAGMGCKQVMVTAPVIVLLYDRIFAAGTFREALRKRWGLYAALVATWALLWASFSQIFDGRSAGFGMVHMKWWEYTLSQFGVILHYLRLSFWPRPLCLDYMWPIAETPEQVLLPGAVMAILVGATCWGLWRRPAGGFLGAWFFLILTPTSSILPINDLAFEHRMYLSLAGVITAVVLGGYALGRALLKRVRPSQGRRLWPKLAAGVIVAAIVAALGAATYDRNKDYRTEEAIWTNIVRQRPNNFRAQNNYGLIQFSKGNIDTAIKAYKTALNLNPGYGLSHHNLGKTYLTLKRYDDAMPHLLEAVELSENNARVFNDLGFGYFRTGKIDQAIDACRKALSIEPNLDEAHYTLALALSRKERFSQAIVHYQQAVDLGFRGPDVYYNLALALSWTQSYDEAIENYQNAISIKPDHKKAHCNLGIALNLVGKAEQAIEHLLEAISIDPDYATAHHNLALVQVGQGSYTDALEHLRRAAELQGDSHRTQDSLARLLSTCPHDSIRNGAEAVELAERACAAVGYKERQYLGTLAAAYAETGQFDRAVATIQRAISLPEAGADTKTIEQLRAHLSLYATGKPLREGK